ncbi:MAG TPA: hypothetical protein VHA56_02995 [Mucilaginibacter sp.]|nr:hypothetical protein [Mucilaginibacter sp.]
MKRTLLILSAFLFLSGCSGGDYKKKALEYLKGNVPDPASVDSVKFIKPDSIYTTFHDTEEYRSLIKSYNNFVIDGDSVNAAKILKTVEEKEKTFKKRIVGWDVRLIYKAKTKSKVLKTDTCRFTFNANLSKVLALNGVNL